MTATVLVPSYRRPDSLTACLDAVLAGGQISPQQKPSMGCSIKWKPGREPDYFKTG